MNKELTLQGDLTIPDQRLKASDVKRLKQLIYWIICQFALHTEADPEKVRDRWLSYVDQDAVETDPEVRKFIQNQINLYQDVSDMELFKKKREKVPKYIKEIIKRFESLISEHEIKSGVI